MNASSPLKIRTNERHFIYLFVISISLVIWQQYGMSTSLDVVPADGPLSQSAFIYSDSINEGQSKGRLTTTAKGIVVDCNIILSKTFAFCGVEFPLVDEGEEGVDIRKYSTMEIELEYYSTEDDTLLVYILNEELPEGVDKPEKANLWAVNPGQGFNRFHLAPERFIVPSWWIYQNSGWSSNLEPDISNATALRITTGDNTVARDVRIIIRQLKFTGKLIPADDLYLGLLIAWLAIFSAHGLRTIRAMSLHFRMSRRHNEELLKLNRFLRIQKDQYESMAKKDELTGAWNRAGIRDLLESVLNDYRNRAVPCALLLIDVDNFKNVNDTFGHTEGDRILAELTTIINLHTRTKDCFARWGGDEFVLICPNTDLRAAGKLAEKLRVTIENSELIPGQKVTCSFGLADLRCEEIEEWFKLADDALYRAKKAGRNRVQSA